MASVKSERRLSELQKLNELTRLPNKGTHENTCVRNIKLKFEAQQQNSANESKQNNKSGPPTSRVPYNGKNTPPANKASHQQLEDDIYASNNLSKPATVGRLESTLASSNAQQNIAASSLPPLHQQLVQNIMAQEVVGNPRHVKSLTSIESAEEMNSQRQKPLTHDDTLASTQRQSPNTIPVYSVQNAHYYTLSESTLSEQTQNSSDLQPRKKSTKVNLSKPIETDKASNLAPHPCKEAANTNSLMSSQHMQTNSSDPPLRIKEEQHNKACETTQPKQAWNSRSKWETKHTLSHIDTPTSLTQQHVQNNGAVINNENTTHKEAKVPFEAQRTKKLNESVKQSAKNPERAEVPSSKPHHEQSKKVAKETKRLASSSKTMPHFETFRTSQALSKGDYANVPISLQPQQVQSSNTSQVAINETSIHTVTQGQLQSVSTEILRLESLAVDISTPTQSIITRSSMSTSSITENKEQPVNQTLVEINRKKAEKAAKPSEKRSNKRNVSSGCNANNVLLIIENTSESVKGNVNSSSDIYQWKAIALKEVDGEFQEVERAFRQSLSSISTRIISIDRIDNPTLRDIYHAKKTEVTKEMRLWHGTSVTFTSNGLVPIVNINSRGFNRSFGGKSTSAVYGDGVYFAVDAITSAKYCKPHNGLRYVYYCRVLVGNYTVGKAGIVEPPVKNFNTLEWFDSVVDDTASPTMFVIFNDAQAIPEYLIKFSSDI